MSKVIIYALLFALMSITEPNAVHAQPASQQSLVFAAGAPLKEYQPCVISSLMREACARLGIAFKTVHYPSPRALEYANSGKVDGDLHRVYDLLKLSDGKYPNLVRINSQLMTIYLAAFAQKGANSVDGLNDLQGYRVGYLRGRQNVHTYLKRYGNIELVPQNTETALFKMLAAGRVDYVVSESVAGQILLKANAELNSIEEVGRLKATRIYSYVNRRHSKLAKSLANVLESMKKDGSFARITKKAQSAVTCK